MGLCQFNYKKKLRTHTAQAVVQQKFWLALLCSRARTPQQHLRLRCPLPFAVGVCKLVSERKILYLLQKVPKIRPLENTPRTEYSPHFCARSAQHCPLMLDSTLAFVFLQQGNLFSFRSGAAWEFALEQRPELGDKATAEFAVRYDDANAVVQAQPAVLGHNLLQCAQRLPRIAEVATAINIKQIIQMPCKFLKVSFHCIFY